MLVGRGQAVSETCLNVAHGRDTLAPERVQKRLSSRLDGELTAEDRAGAALRDAVGLFWSEFHSGANAERQIELAGVVYGAVRQVQTERWHRLEATHGKVSHYFDAFGQIKERYRRQVRSDSQATTLSIGGIALLALVAVAAWWFS
jgi:hypothetical protein